MMLITEATTQSMDPAGAGLVRLVLSVSVISVLVASGLAAAAMRFGRRRTWQLCGWIAALLATGWWLMVATTWPAILHPIGSFAYMICVLAVVPLALATAAVNRSVARHPQRSLGGHALRGWLGFLLGGVLATVLAIIPDFVQFMLQNGAF